MTDPDALNTQIAERLLELRRGCCTGHWGGGSTDGRGHGHTYFYCRYCGARIEDGQAGACPAWPWPDYVHGEQLDRVIVCALTRLRLPLVVDHSLHAEGAWYEADFGAPEHFLRRSSVAHSLAEAICRAALRGLADAAPAAKIWEENT